MNSGLLDRVRDVNDKEINADGEYVLYWMISARRFNYNAALEHAANLAKGPAINITTPTAINTAPSHDVLSSNLSFTHLIGSIVYPPYFKF